MSDFEEFVDYLGDATKQLFDDIGDAWNELKEDLRETVTVRYLRPGATAYCRADGKKYYGILTGTQIISLNAEKEPEYMELADFLNQHGAEKLKVAGKNRIAVGSHEVDYAARMAVEEERFPSTKTFVLKCLGVADASSVDDALEKKFGSFEWLTYDLQEESGEDESEEHQESSAE
ncbi:MAG: hypothetical protein J5858_16500 [Lentisphaeria bacterium]|nr:hypothetical protein [Lentisphaeria bacterium]